ncbi:porin [Methylomarinum sp. Ch1-1]|uniref:Porin n=1 Tax=Methylomarinum roseum TaxID=3067653 RepID=A0AAU7NTE7_9GAMM|nr:porin [Methylomarinum sp. Ch1-1]MDP4519739.1 porin [Methylomarinum sp. Ch1-1]
MRKNLIATPLIGGVLLTGSVNLHAEGLVESLTGNNVNDTQALKDLGIEIGGWADAGITYASHSNKSGNNGAIPFGTDRVNEFQLNQAYLYVEKAVDTSGSEWDIGGRVDFMFGTDAPSTQAGGWDDQILGSDENKDFNQYDVAFPQAYAEIFAPIGNGLTVKAGHFYTIIGYEVVTSPDNFFYSHAFTMNYGEPFTHTGALATYQINDNWSISGGAVDGWDNFRREGGDWSFLGGANWTSDDEKTWLALSLISGEDGDDSVGQNTTMYSVVFGHDFADNLHYVFQHDFGVVEDGNAPGDDADWYGINQYLTYDINEKLSAGLRAEWFSDRGGRINSFGTNYYAATAGLNYSPLSWLKLRPEVRYDWADTNGAGAVFGGNKNEQVQVAMDMIITF